MYYSFCIDFPAFKKAGYGTRSSLPDGQGTCAAQIRCDPVRAGIGGRIGLADRRVAHECPTSRPRLATKWRKKNVLDTPYSVKKCLLYQNEKTNFSGKA